MRGALMVLNKLDGIGASIASLRKARHFREKIRSINEKLDQMKVSKLKQSQIDEVRSFWRPFGIKPYLGWHRFFTWGWGSFHPAFIPEDIYYTRLEMAGSKANLVKAYVDKNNYSRLFGNDVLPKTIIRKENGIFSDAEYHDLTFTQATNIVKRTAGRFVVKPSLLSGGGRGLIIGSVTDGNIKTPSGTISIASFLKESGPDIIMEEFLDQHPSMDRLHPGSVNTIKVFTARAGGTIKFLSSYVRMGTGNAQIDNIKAGGISCGIDQSGRLKALSLNNSLVRHPSHPDTGIVFSGFQIPDFEKVKELSIEIHKKLRYFKFASWDIAIERNRGPVMIEVNLYGQEINSHQIFSGPLFEKDSHKLLNELLY